MIPLNNIYNYPNEQKPKTNQIKKNQTNKISQVSLTLDQYPLCAANHREFAESVCVLVSHES